MANLTSRGASPGDPPAVTVPPVAAPPAGAPAAASPGRADRGRWWALAAITASFLVVGLDSYIVVTALPTFSVKLGASESQLQWITAAYTLAWAGLLLPIGKLGDKLGRRKVLMAGLAVFGITSVVASQVTSAGELIALRAVMGAGAAVIMPMGLAILPVLFPGEADRRRAVTVTTIGAMVSLPGGGSSSSTLPSRRSPCSRCTCSCRKAVTRPIPGWTGPAHCYPLPA